MKRFTLSLALAALLPLSAIAQDSLYSAPNAAPARITDFAFYEAPDDHAIGNPEAAVTLIAWASVTCPHCSHWFTTEWPTIKSELVETGKLRFVFRAFPTAPAELAMPGFLFAECAPSDEYMSIIEYQMREREAIAYAAQNGRGRNALNKIAKIAGMEDREAITACLRNPDMLAQIQDSALRADAAKVRAVPAFVMNGQPYKGQIDAKTLVKMITEINEKTSSSSSSIMPAANESQDQDHQ